MWSLRAPLQQHNMEQLCAKIVLYGGNTTFFFVVIFN